MNVLMLIMTSGLDYDDRLRKESLSLVKLGCAVRIIAVEYDNRPEEKIVYDAIPASTIRLQSRKWFARTQALPLKLVEMYAKFLLHVLRQRPDTLWVHNLEMSGLIPILLLLRTFGVMKRIVWDQHELPSDSMLGNRAYLWLYGLLVNQCDVVVMANQERRDLILQKIPAISTPIQILHNYPDQIFQQLPQNALPQDVLEWLQGRPYALAQGGASPGRHLPQLISAIMQQPVLKLIVVGPYQPSQLDELDRLYGDTWRERVWFTGYVPQLEITPFVDHAIASVVFYTMANTNSRLCAPNRLYQGLIRGIPVVVGPNPPMRQLVEKFGCGVVVDPGDFQSILRGLEEIRVNWEPNHRAALNASSQMLWESHEQVIKSIISDKNEGL